MKHELLFLSIALLAAVGCRSGEETRPQRRNIVDAVFASGHIENSNQYTVMANAEGFVRTAFVKEGDSVHAGQSLFRLVNDVQQTQVHNAATNLEFAETNARQGSPQLEQLKAQIVQARHKLSVDSANYQRYARLVKTQAVSASDFENARLNFQGAQSNLTVLEKNLADLQRNLDLNVANARAQYDIQRENNNYYDVTSITPGVVMNVTRKNGDLVRKGDALATMRTGGIVIKLDIAEDDIDRVTTGQKVLVSLNSRKEETYEATVSRIYPFFNTATQSFTVEAVFNKVPDHLLNGTQLQANIIVRTRDQALVIPSYCLLNDSFVLVKGKKEQQRVTTGIRTLEWTEITGGLSEKDVLSVPNR